MKPKILDHRINKYVKLFDRHKIYKNNIQEINNMNILPDSKKSLLRYVKLFKSSGRNLTYIMSFINLCEKNRIDPFIGEDMSLYEVIAVFMTLDIRVAISPPFATSSKKKMAEPYFRLQRKKENGNLEVARISLVNAKYIMANTNTWILNEDEKKLLVKILNVKKSGYNYGFTVYDDIVQAYNSAIIENLDVDFNSIKIPYDRKPNYMLLPDYDIL